MECAGCGSPNRDGAVYCAACGAKLLGRCRSCDRELPDGARFCDACGASTAEVGPEPSAPAGVRKVVTVLFADLAGSTGLQERLDAETTQRVMDRVHALLRGAVESNDGHVVKLLGDGLMAVFGVPTVREDDARRAVRAAADMQRAFAALAAELTRLDAGDVGLRVGVNTGEVVVPFGATDPVGDPVNVAARLEAAAPHGGVLVGSGTYRLVRDVVRMEAVGPLSLKGKREPVAAYVLVDAAEAPLAGSTVFVGRSTEVQALRDVFEEAVAAARCRLVTVLGSPGVGKSRLAAEVSSVLAGRARVVEARCPPDAARPFGPIVDALRAELGLDEGSPVSDVERSVTDVLAGLDDAALLAPALTGLLTGGPAASAQEALWALRRLWEAWAHERPVVVLVDDVQWADPALWDLVEHLAEWVREAAVLVVALARPELRELRPSLVEAGGSAARVIVLGGLDAPSCARLALDLLDADELPDEIVVRVVEAGDGNPLFVRELTRMLVDDGVLARHGGRWVATVEASGVELPVTVNAVLAARIEQLRAGERAVLEAAAVVGRHFARGAVAALLPGPDAADLDLHLDSLRRRELIDPDFSVWVDERMFRFHHMLIRDAAYRRVLKEVRADLHERYAAWLERRLGAETGEYDEVLGWHLAQAQEYRRELGLGGTDGLAERAAAYLAAAGRRWLEREHPATAADLLERAVQLVPEIDERRPSLLRDLCDALLASGDSTAASRAVAELRRTGRADPQARAITSVYEARLAGLRSPEALRTSAEAAARAVDVFVAAGDHTGVVEAETVQALALGWLGQVAACERALDRALTAARHAGDRRRANAVLSIAPVAALWGPSSIERASGRCLDIIRVLRITTGAPHVEAHVLRCQAVLEAMRDRPDIARRMLDSARATFADMGHRLGLLDTEFHAGLVELLAGAPVTAEVHLRAALRGFEELGSEVAAARVRAALARSLVEQDRFAEAEAVAEPVSAGDDLKAAIGSLGVRAEALAHAGRVVEAEQHARRAVKLAAPTDALVDHGDARLALAAVLLVAGRHPEAAAEAARAVELYEAKGSTAGARAARRRVSAAIVAEPEQPTARPGPPPSDDAPPGGDRDAGSDRSREVAPRPAGAVRRVRPNRASDALAHEDRSPGREVVVTLGDRHAVTDDADGYVVVSVDHDGRVARGAPIDRLADAVAELVERWAQDELEGDARTRALGSRSALLAAAAFEARDWDRFAEAYAPDVVTVDHRPLGWGMVEGRAALIGLARGLADVADELHVEVTDVLAVTADAILMCWDVDGVRSGGRFQIPTVVVARFGPDGALAHNRVFRPEQLEEAWLAFDGATGPAPSGASGPDSEEAYRRAMAEAGDAAEVVRWFWDRQALLSDADGWRAGWAADGVMVDHRPASFDVSDPDRAADIVRAARPLARAQSIRVVEVVRVERWGIAVQVVHHGVTRGGGRFEIPILTVEIVRHGLCARLEMFDPADVTRAEACLDRHRPTPSHAAAPNAACRLAFPEATDHRPLATFGDRLAVIATDGTDHGLWVVEADAALTTVERRTAFSPGELTTALAAMYERGAELAGDAEPVVRNWQGWRSRYNAHDLDHFLDHYTADVVMVDHRPASFGTLAGQHYLDALRSSLGAADEVTMYAVETPRAESWGLTCRLRFVGRSSEGAEFEVDMWGTYIVDDGRFCRVEGFPSEDGFIPAEAVLDRHRPTTPARSGEPDDGR